MKRTGSKGLMGFWADIDEDYVLRFREWHNCEHIPERVGIPGFNVGRRYRGLDGAPMFFMFYETDDPAVLGSEAYLSALERPTPWTRESLTHFRNPNRNIYALLAESGAPAPLEAPYLLLYRLNLADETEAEVLSWLADTWLPAVTAIAEVYRGRLYRVDEAISGIMTSERKLYGGGPGAQKFLALFETTTPHTDGEEAWKAAESALADGHVQLARRRDVFAESFWLDIALYSP